MTGRRKLRDSGGGLARFVNYKVDPAAVRELAADHPAVVEGRTMFPGNVVGAFDTGVSGGGARYLISGKNNAKIGDVITKGPWKGLPIYTLTLEERRTCPRSCPVWRGCLLPEAKVLTADLRWVRQDELQVGQRIAGFDEFGAPRSHRMTRIATVEKLGRETKPCLKVTTTKGSVVCSTDHLWLASRGARTDYPWRSANRLKVGDRLLHFGEPWETDLSYDAGRLRGFVEGEGTMQADGVGKYAKARVTWFQRPSPLCDEIEALGHRLGFSTTRHSRVAGVNRTECDHIDLKGGWREVARFLGSIRPTRFIERAESLLQNHSIGGRGATSAEVLAIEDVGEREVVTIQTSTGTMIAEGFYTHNCYGNAMQWPRRHDHQDSDFIPALAAEVITMARRHPKGLAIRLHVLGDFYSVGYVLAWAQLLEMLPNLHVFGFTARRLDDPDPESRRIAAAVQALNSRWSRWAIRTSHPEPGRDRSVVVDGLDVGAGVIVCPAQTERTAACATCALCWSPSARDKTIAFLRHGIKISRAPRTLKESLPMPFWTDARTELAIKLWSSRKATAEQIGDYLGCTKEAMVTRMRRLGIDGGVGKGGRGEPLALTLRAMGLPMVCEA